MAATEGLQAHDPHLIISRCSFGHNEQLLRYLCLSLSWATAGNGVLLAYLIGQKLWVLKSAKASNWIYSELERAVGPVTFVVSNLLFGAIVDGASHTERFWTQLAGR